MGAVICDGSGLLKVRGRKVGRQRVQLQHDESEAADVRRPAAQMPHQILFQFIGKNFLSQMCKRAAASCRAAPLRIIGGRNVRTIVVQKRTHVQQIVNIKADRFQISRQQRRAVDVSIDGRERSKSETE